MAPSRGWRRPAPAEPRCFSAMNKYGHDLSRLSWRSEGGAIDHTHVSACLAYRACAAAALLVRFGDVEGYTQRLIRREPLLRSPEFPSHSWPLRLRSAFSTESEPRFMCVPTACVAQGEGTLLRGVLANLLLWHLRALPTAQAGLLPPFTAAEVAVERWLGAAEEPPGAVQPGDRGGLDAGLCMCSEEGAEGHPSLALATRMLREFEAPGHPSRAKWRRLLGCPRREPAGSREMLRVAFELDAAEAGCLPGLLNICILCAVAAKHRGTESAAAMLGRLEAAVGVSLLARDCPVHRPSSVYSAGIAPLADLPSAVLQLRGALDAFALGGKTLGNATSWTARRRFRCDPDAADAAYRRRAQAPKAALPRYRVFCMFPAVYPADEARMEQVGRTFALHCDYGGFFVADPALSDQMLWKLGQEHGVKVPVVNLASHAEFFPPDEQMFRMGSSEEGGVSSEEAARKKVAEGNTIVKVLAMFNYVGTTMLDTADIFCKVDLDTAIVPENLDAWARASGLDPEDMFWIGSPVYWRKYSNGVYPDGGAGLCVTRGALKVLAAHIRAMPWGLRADEAHRHCHYQAGHYEDVVLGHCLRLLNITAHPAVEDALGRAYASHGPLPCREHLPGPLAALAGQPALGTGRMGSL